MKAYDKTTGRWVEVCSKQIVADIRKKYREMKARKLYRQGAPLHDILTAEKGAKKGDYARKH